MDGNTNQSTLIVMPNWLGDFIMALSVIIRMGAKQRHGITLVCKPWLMPLAEVLCSMPCIAYDRSNKAAAAKTLRTIKDENFNRIIVLPHSFSSAWLAFRTGIPERRGIAAEARGLLLTDRVQASAADRTVHLTNEYAAVIGTPFFPPEDWPGHAVQPDEKYRGHTVVCPGATYGPAKRWPYFKELLLMLNDRPVVLLGGEGDSAGLDGLGNSVVDRTGKTTLPQAAAIIAAADAVVANDSGLMHMAGFIGTPVVGIFGSSSPSWTRPLGPRVSVVNASVRCAPCFRPECAEGHYHCLNELTAEKVFEHLEIAKGLRI